METAPDLNEPARLGVDKAQGWYIGRPQPVPLSATVLGQGRFWPA